MTFAIAICMR